MHSRFVLANGLRHHILEWDGPSDKTVVILHGYLDLARSFDLLGNLIQQSGFRVLAPDLRGFGETDWVPEGAQYHFPDYLADLTFLLEALNVPPCHLVGHSMGGSVATLYAGSYPDRLQSLTLLEGVGLPAMSASDEPERHVIWIESIRQAKKRGVRVMASMNEVVERMLRSNPGMPRAILESFAERAVREVSGGYTFRFDPMHQTTSPRRFDADAFEAFVSRITCPVLMVDGGDISAAHPELVARATQYPISKHVSLEGAGHMMHWTRPERVADIITQFLLRLAPILSS